MTRDIDIEGRSLRVQISRAAQEQLCRRSDPLLLEMELYFSCLVRKRVYVRESAGDREVLPVADKLKVWFRPVVTRTCSISSCEGGPPPVDDLPITRPERYFPRWLTLDYRGGQWQADFGYAGMAD